MITPPKPRSYPHPKPLTRALDSTLASCCPNMHLLLVERGRQRAAQAEFWTENTVDKYVRFNAYLVASLSLSDFEQSVRCAIVLTRFELLMQCWEAFSNCKRFVLKVTKYIILTFYYLKKQTNDYFTVLLSEAYFGHIQLHVNSLNRFFSVTYLTCPFTVVFTLSLLKFKCSCIIRMHTVLFCRFCSNCSFVEATLSL